MISFEIFKRQRLCHTQWCTLAILKTWEVEARRISIEIHPFPGTWYLSYMKHWLQTRWKGRLTHEAAFWTPYVYTVVCMRLHSYIYKCTVCIAIWNIHTYMCAHTQFFKTVTVQNSRWMNKFRDLLYNMVSINNELYPRKLPRQQIFKYYHDQNWQVGYIKS